MPGADFEDKNSNFKLIFCAVYCFLNVAIIGTCLSMIFSGIKRAIHKFIKFIKKLWSKFTCREQTLEDKRREELEMLSRIKQLKYYFDDDDMLKRPLTPEENDLETHYVKKR